MGLRTHEKLGVASLLITSILFGIFGVLAKLLGNWLSVFQTAFIVCLLQTIGFLIFLLIKKGKFTIQRRDIPTLFALLIIQTMPFFLFVLAVRLTSIGSVLIMQNVITLLISILYDYKKKKHVIQVKQLLLLLIALIGIASMYLPFNHISSWGLIAASGVGITNAGANIFRSYLAKRYTIAQLSVLSSATSTFVWGVVLLCIHTSIFPMHIAYIQPLLLVVLYTLLQMVTTAGLFIGFRFVHITLGNLLLMLEIIFGILTGVIFIHEYLSLKDFMIILMILLSIFIIHLIDIEQRYQIELTN